MLLWQLVLLFFCIAFIYASVGFGGGSSYIAVLAIGNLPVFEMKLTALVCNIVVVMGGTWLYIKHKQLNWKKTGQLVALSVPMAALGATVKLSNDSFYVLLGLSLFMAAVLLLFQQSVKEAEVKQPNTVKNVLMGGVIGLLSGMVGIGGGVFLSPLLHLSSWDTAKKIAATASFFILVNSVSGLVAHLCKPHPETDILQLLPLMIAVLLGGQLGSRLGLQVLPQLMVKRVTGILIMTASVELLRAHLHINF